jgi:hypothetical protein
MSKKVAFSAFDPIRFDTPSGCDVCALTPPCIPLRVHHRRNRREQVRKGFCCGACSARLLEKLQLEESRVWAEEEASLKADDVDVSDLEERRVATLAKGLGS